MLIELNKNAVLEITDLCPFCKVHSKPEIIHHHSCEGFKVKHTELDLPTIKPILICPSKIVKYYQDSIVPVRLVTLQCTHCHKPYSFLAYLDPYKEQYTPYHSPLIKIPIDHNGLDEIATISPTGYEIYEQALNAERDGYNQLVGIGLRKALEFCLKDFLIKLHSEDVDKIKRMPLKQLIDNYITDPTMQKLTTVCVFLGNDETHYTRKHTDKDIQALKHFIKLSFQMITQQISARQVEQDFFQ